ncbi:hypothetical protein SAMN02799630_01790 [Paenibacillus sp. UNCCL117]|nr:hypothetical protein SAMN04488602_104278 [Paenibacillus sp. cl123]SFW29680.1 hypothetical protein SAMN02799630_01790 [Paenibacillus sp. UNCCL117]
MKPNEARFPIHKFEVSKPVIVYIAKQIFCESELYTQYEWSGRGLRIRYTVGSAK